MIMWNWISCYCLSLAFTLHLGNMIRPAFDKKNITMNPLTGKSQYSIWDEEYKTNFQCSLIKGVLLSKYTVITSILMFVAMVGMWFFAEHWWECLIALILGFIVQNMYTHLVRINIDSPLFYVELVANPLIYGLMVYFLIWY